jgi:DNA-binding MurR/RpiR family transcriptional regulator
MEATAATVRERIVSAGDRLSPAERRVARTLLAEYPVAGLHTAGNLAKAAAVSGPTVVRFARSLGFASFRDLQSSLREEVQQRQESNLSQATTTAGGAREPQSTFQAAKGSYINGIEQTFAANIAQEVDGAVALLADVRANIVAFGGPYSGFLADYLVAQLSPLRPQVRTLPSNPLLAAGLLDELRPTDVVVVFDFRRYTESLQPRARAARQQGSKLVLVTDRWLSPVAEYATHVITAEVKASGPSDTLVPALALIEAVCEAVAESLGSAALERLQRVDPVRTELQ